MNSNNQYQQSNRENQNYRSNRNNQYNQNQSNQNHRNESQGGCHHEMNMLRALDFAIQETVLYLDAYPENQQALDYYHELMEQRNRTMEAYERNCGPLTMYGNTSRNSWDWVEGPWPWEADAN